MWDLGQNHLSVDTFSFFPLKKKARKSKEHFSSGKEQTEISQTEHFIIKHQVRVVVKLTIELNINTKNVYPRDINDDNINYTNIANASINNINIYKWY